MCTYKYIQIKELFLHQKSDNVDKLGFSVFLHASPIDVNTAVTTSRHQSKIQGCNDPSFYFKVPCSSPACFSLHTRPVPRALPSPAAPFFALLSAHDSLLICASPPLFNLPYASSPRRFCLYFSSVISSVYVELSGCVRPLLLLFWINLHLLIGLVSLAFQFNFYCSQCDGTFVRALCLLLFLLWVLLFVYFLCSELYNLFSEWHIWFKKWNIVNSVYNQVSITDK